MKIAIFSEASADDAAIQNYVAGLLGKPIDAIGVPWLRTRGWPSILDVLPKVVQYLHYQTDTRGLVVVADSDLSPVHQQLPEHGAVCAERCRYCRLWKAVAETRSRLGEVPGRVALGVAIGIAIPSIEAWYRCGLDHHVSEAAWTRALESGIFPYDTKRLKRTIYDTERPTLARAMEKAVEHSRRLVDADGLSRLEESFPVGFGGLAVEVRSWR
jgi:hypothetical protein